MADPVARLAGVGWTYARARGPALAGLSLEIGEGEFVAVMGESGAGKTTFCRLLNGLVPHSLPGRLLGEVEIDGIPTRSSSVAALAEKVGMAFDDPDAQLLTSRAIDEVAFALENMEVPPGEIAERAAWALGAAGLAGCAWRAPSTLSGGQKQRLVVAAAMAMAGRLLVLDEPCSRLDPAGARDVLSLVSALRGERGLAVVMATGSPEDAARFADRVLVLKGGRLAASGPPRRVFSGERLLAAAGVDPPEASQLAFRMAALGEPLPGFPIGAAEAAELVMGWYSGGGGISAGAAPPPLDAARSPRPGGRPDAIRVERLRYAYESRPDAPALDGASVAIGEGEFAAILGPNGSGKTTLLKSVAGLLRPQGGGVAIRGEDAGLMSVEEISREVGFVMQDSDGQLFERTVFDEVAFALRLPPRGGGEPPGEAEVRRRAEEALEALGLQDKRGEFPPSLGAADRARTVLAAVLATGARTLLLDEPLAGQDARGARAVLGALEGLSRRGLTIVMATHSVRAAAEHAHRLVVMGAGRVRLDGPAAHVLDREGELAEAGILLPPAAWLSRELRRRGVPLERAAASPAELAAMLAAARAKGPRESILLC